MESWMDDSNHLVDINTIFVDENLSKEERIADFIKKIKNPYCFKCGDTVVHIAFADTNRTIEDCLVDYLKTKISILDHNRHKE